MLQTDVKTRKITYPYGFETNRLATHSHLSMKQHVLNNPLRFRTSLHEFNSIGRYDGIPTTRNLRRPLSRLLYTSWTIVYQRYGLVLQGSQTQWLATAPTGETPATILEQSNQGTSESRELQLRQLATSLFLIRILIKFNAYITAPLAGVK